MAGKYAPFLDNNTIDAQGFGRILGGILDAGVVGTGSWLVSQRGAGANQSVDVAVGFGLLDDILGYVASAYSTSVQNVSAPAAHATNDRHDILIGYIDKSVTATTNGLDALVFVFVSGTAAGSPIDPDATALQAGAGSGNPYIILSRRVTPANNNTVTDAQLTDLRPSALAPEAGVTTFTDSDVDDGAIQSFVSGAWNDINSMSQVLTTTGGRCKVKLAVPIDNTGSAGTVLLRIMDGATPKFKTSVHVGAVGTRIPVSLNLTIPGLSAAAHTFKLQGRMLAGGGATARFFTGQSYFRVEEVKT